jgi:hypothetical protein
MSPEEKQKLVELFERWNEVQGNLKQAEQINQLAVIPAINELRYAGRILVHALARGLHQFDLADETKDAELNGSSLSESMVIAGQYLTNAQHDISDALVYFFQQRVDELNGRYGAAAITEKFPDYAELIKRLRKCRELVIESRKDLSKRGQNYKEMRGHSDYLIENYFTLDKTDTFMAIELEVLYARERKFKWLSIGAGLLAAVFALLWLI